MNLFELQSNEFAGRHIGPRKEDATTMLQTIGVQSLDELIVKTVPDAIRMKSALAIPSAMSEAEYLRHIKEVSMKNEVFRSYIVQGYYDTYTPSVILRNIFENP